MAQLIMVGVFDNLLSFSPHNTIINVSTPYRVTFV